MTKRKPTITTSTLTIILKDAIRNAGVSRYQIAKDTGILETSLSRFMRGETSLRLDKADVLAEYLGLQLIQRKS